MKRLGLAHVNWEGPRCFGHAPIVVATASFVGASRQLGASRQRERRQHISSSKTFGPRSRQLEGPTLFRTRSNRCDHRVVWDCLTSTGSLKTTRAQSHISSGKTFGPRSRQLGGRTLFAGRSNRRGHRVVWARLTSNGRLETTRAPSHHSKPQNRLGLAHVNREAARCLRGAPIVVATASFGRASRQLGVSR